MIQSKILRVVAVACVLLSSCAAIAQDDDRSTSNRNQKIMDKELRNAILEQLRMQQEATDPKISRRNAMLEQLRMQSDATDSEPSRIETRERLHETLRDLQQRKQTRVEQMDRLAARLKAGKNEPNAQEERRHIEREMSRFVDEIKLVDKETASLQVIYGQYQSDEEVVEETNQREDHDAGEEENLHRLEHMARAIDHLHESGLHEHADRVERHAREFEMSLEERGHRNERVHAILERMLHQMDRLTEQVDRLSGELESLKRAR